MPTPNVREALLQQFIQQVPAAIAMFDLQMCYLHVSDRWIKDCELQGQQIIGRCHYDVVPNIPDRWKAVHRRVLSGAVETCERDVFLHADGTTECLHWQLQPWRTEDGTIGGLIMFTQFITERVRVEEALRASEDRFRSAMNHSPIGMAIVSLDGQILDANPALCQIFGYDLPVVRGMDLLRITHPDDMTVDFADLRRLYDGEIENFEVEKRYRHRARHDVVTQLNVSLIRTINGAPRHFVCQIQDITLRKREEQAFQQTAAKLTLAMDMARLGYWEYDVATACFAFDDDFYRLFGTTAARQGGRAMSATDYVRRFILSNDASIVEQEIARAIAAADVNYTRQLEHHFLRSDGTIGIMAVRFSIQKDFLGRTIKMYGVNQDVTEQKRLEEKHRALETQLSHAQKLEAIGTLTGGLGHEFNNLLTGIIGHVQLAEMDLPNGSVVRSCLREAMNSCRRACALASHLLSFSHSVEPMRSPVPFAGVVSDALEQLSSTLTPTMELRADLAKGSFSVLCNAAQIAQAIAHIGANAVRAMRERGGVLEVTLRHDAPDAEWTAAHPQVGSHHTVQLSFRDSGIGMSTSVLARIFDPFFSTKSPGQGQGLGLPVVHGIMKRHGGAIVVESAQGRGTTVHLFFPQIEESIA